jgi:hypothetical protein
MCYYSLMWNRLGWLVLGGVLGSCGEGAPAEPVTMLANERILENTGRLCLGEDVLGTVLLAELGCERSSRGCPRFNSQSCEFAVTDNVIEVNARVEIVDVFGPEVVCPAIECQLITNSCGLLEVAPGTYEVRYGTRNATVTLPREPHDGLRDCFEFDH